MAAQMYSLFRLYGNKRWVRASNKQLPVKQAKQEWNYLVTQLSMLSKPVLYDIRPIPKSEIRRKILEKETQYG